MHEALLDRVRTLCLSLPEARELEAWGSPTFRVKTMFATCSEPGRYGALEGGSVWIKSDLTNQELLVARDPERFFVPPYVGAKGWVGIHLDDAVDWAELESLLWDAWRMSVTKTLAAKHPPQSD